MCVCVCVSVRVCACVVVVVVVGDGSCATREDEEAPREGKPLFGAGV